MSSQRAKIKLRAKLKGSTRLVIKLSNRNTEAQIIDPTGKVLLVVSTEQADIKKLCAGSYGNKKAAKIIGEQIAEKASKLKINDRIKFDRSGYLYHGRTEALANAAREKINF